MRQSSFKPRDLPWAQRTFSKVWNHFQTQSVRATASNDSYLCAYRGPAGTSCAIGCLIPDALYKPSMEAKAVADLVSGYATSSPALITCLLGRAARTDRPLFRRRLAFLAQLQAQHDLASDIDQVRSKLRDLAAQRNLRIPR